MLSVQSLSQVKVSLPRAVAREQVWLAVGVLGIAMRLYVVHASVGCNDVQMWNAFAREIHKHGLGYLYDNEAGFNHPPLMGLLAGFCMKLALLTGGRFEVFFKLPSVFADMLSAILIHQSWQLRRPRYAALAFALFCWSPVSILVSAFHGNTDSIGASLCLLAALLVDRARPMLGGVALGAAINVKLIPLMLIPLLVSTAGGPRRIARFLIGLSVGAIPFIPVLVWHGKGFYEHALLYRSNLDQWGITGLLAQMGTVPNAAPLAQKLKAFWMDQGARPIFLAAFVLAAVNLWKGRWDARTLTACGFACFLFLTPGFGVQYLVYPVPALFSVDVKRGGIYSTTSGLFAFLIYYAALDGTQPFFAAVPALLPVGLALEGYGAWLSALQVVIHLL